MTFKTNYQKLSLAEPLILEPGDWTFHEWAALCKLCGLPAGPTERIVLHVDVMEYFQNLSKEPVDTERTYTVTEVCPHCESEVEMRWDTDRLGFKAYCPVCGKRLMLCDECRHAETPGPCDYDNALDCCQHNPPSPSTASEAPPAAQVDTPLGIITVKTAVDPAHPGVYIDLRRKGTDLEMPLALVEFSADDADYPDGTENLITRVWGNAMKEDYTYRAVHQKIQEYFAAEEEQFGRAENK